MNKKLYMQKAVRRAGAEASVNLSKVRAWFADNAITYGYMQLADHYNRNITQVETQVLDAAVYASAAAQSGDMQAMIDFLVEPTTDREGYYELPVGGELQPGSENGTPVVTQGYRKISQGYPMWRGMDGFGWNREAYAKKTVADMDKAQLAVNVKDSRWMMRRLLAPIFTNVAWTYSEEGYTDVTVRPLATTADGAIYLDFNGDLFTAEHYTGQAGAIANDANPYLAQRTILRKHPSNVGRIVSYINEDLQDATVNLAGFLPYNGDDGLVDYGDDVDLASSSIGRYKGFGNEVLGVVSENVIVLSRRIPAGYVLSIVDGLDKPLVMRQEPEAELQGLQVVPFQVDSNFRRWDFYRKAGFAVRNPIAMAIREISDASYDIPTGYDARIMKG